MLRPSYVVVLSYNLIAVGMNVSERNSLMVVGGVNTLVSRTLLETVRISLFSTV
jgi:hypothetical protein